MFLCGGCIVVRRGNICCATVLCCRFDSYVVTGLLIVESARVIFIDCNVVFYLESQAPWEPC